MIEASAFIAVLPYAILASFPLFGLAIVTKWVFDDRKKGKKKLQTSITK